MKIMSELEILSSLKLNLQNAEATFGRDSSQYFDILEIIENFMATMGQEEEQTNEPAAAPKQESTTQSASTMNLVFRPKPR